MAKRDASRALGGASGKAASILRGRGAALRSAIDDAESGRPAAKKAAAKKVVSKKKH